MDMGASETVGGMGRFRHQRSGLFLHGLAHGRRGG